MRLFQLVGLAALALVIFKFIGLAANGAFDGLTARNAFEGLTVQQALAQEKETPAPAKAEKAQNAGDAKAARGLSKSANGQVGKSDNSREGLLSRLSERRDALDKREQDLALREELLKAAEKSLKAKLAKIKKGQGQGGGAGGKDPKEGLKDLVVMYESMKPKDAARIFNTLSLGVMYQLAAAINPRKMSGILAEMDVKAAERLTVEIAGRALGKANGKQKRKLSKIGG